MGIKEKDPRRGVGASLRLAAEFFGRADPLAEAVADFLYYYREASGERTEFGLATHALCAVLEGLVREVVTSRKLANPKNAPEVTRFERARAAAVQILKSQSAEVDSAAAQRIMGAVQALAPFDIREQFRLVAQHLDLPWEGLLEQQFQAWKTHRNLTHHGRLRDKRDEEFMNQATIAAAINLIVLRLVGYRGTAFRCLWGYLRQDVVCQI